ncbi:MAG: hypothetical protein DME30_00535 [Verrucomicrobia bacterium]|nr:MAG: hypothetical protein DME30_00535 [Verrucomicrobiota bacterium]
MLRTNHRRIFFLIALVVGLGALGVESATEFHFRGGEGPEMRYGSVGNRDDMVASDLDTSDAGRNERGQGSHRQGDEDGAGNRS